MLLQDQNSATSAAWNGIGGHRIERRRSVATRSIDLSYILLQILTGPGLEEDWEDSFGDQQDNAKLRSYIH
jgi:hypothetical protein